MEKEKPEFEDGTDVAIMCEMAWADLHRDLAESENPFSGYAEEE